MKKTILTVATALIVAAQALAIDYGTQADGLRFEAWVKRVYKLAPRYGLRMDRDEGTDEFFYLYCWQSRDHRVVHAIRLAKKVWDPNG